MTRRGTQPLLGFLIALASTLAAGCGVDNGTPFAPSGSVLTIKADSLLIPPNSSTTITVQLKKTDGSPVADGVEISLGADAGELDQRKLRLSNGQASVVYRSGPAVGQAKITASSGAVTAELQLRIGSAPPGSVSLVSSPLEVPPTGADVEIIATVSSSTGALVAGAPVTFSTTAGSLSATQVITNDRGEARATLRTNVTTTVSAKVQNLETSTTVRLKQRINVAVSTAPAEPSAGQSVQVTARVTDGDGRGVNGRLRFTFGDGGSQDVGAISGSGSTAYTWAREGGYNLSAEFTDQEGFLTRETVRVTVRSGATTPPTDPNPPPKSGGADQLDPRQVTWLHRDVSSWPITSTVTDVTITRSEMCVDHSGAGRFPTSQFGTIQVEGNVWIFAQINGRWYGATYDWLRPGQVCKGVTGDELGRDQIRIAPMDASWPGPRSGDTVGFMVSARARDDVSAGAERTNIVLVRWP